MANKIQFYLLDLTYKVINDKAQICIFGKTQDNEKIILFDKEFRPYFYIIPKNSTLAVIDRLKNIKVEKRDFLATVTETEVVEKQYKGKKVEAIKVYTNLPRSVPAIAEKAKEWDIVKSCNEFDILFTKRYSIDKNLTPLTLHEAILTGEITKNYKVKSYSISNIEVVSGDYLREMDILAFDIETYHTGGKPNPEKDPVIMVSLYGKNYKKVITYKKFKTKHDYIEFVDDEIQLIERFKKIIKKIKPDIITGYYSDGFDFPYLRDRAKKYKIRLDLGLDMTNVNFGRGKNPSAQINGILHIDILQFIRKNIGQSLKTDSYKLDNVAQEILGEKKIDVDLGYIGEAWDKNKDLETYAEYNLQDSRLTYKLCKKFMPNIIEFTNIIGSGAFEIARMSFSQIVENYLLKQAPKFNIIAPNRPGHDKIKKRRMKTYPGAFVYQPTPGLYKDIIIFDFRSLYPTIISSHNIEPDTLNCSCCIDKAEKTPTEKKDYWFCKRKKGFIPTIIEDVITRRMRIKEIIKKKKNKDKSAEILLEARQYSLKIMANSMYGYLGFFGARWYSIECARSITAFARDYIKKVIKQAKDEGFNVIYADTDSVFITLDGKTKKDAERFRDKINANLPGILELELEGFFPSGIFVSAKIGVHGAKKKYALLLEEGGIKITGFETVRSNWSKIAKEVQKKVLGIILKENNKEKALKYVQDTIQKLNENKIDIEKVVIHTQLTKDLGSYEAIGPHVAIARKMQAKGIDVSPGTIIKYVICKGSGVIRDRAKLESECSSKDYDPEYYIKNQVIPTIDKIFEVLGITKEDILKSGKQKDLSSFFS